MASISVGLKPWMVPGFACPVNEDMKSVPLSELSNTALSDMCDEFRVGVFKAAGKVDPKGFNVR